ncbi:zinc ion binding nucleic acid binding [Euphorbia peplus]|nr:zinc ion binding nucleic acid binding [Euphorbia peplus]
MVQGHYLTVRTWTPEFSPSATVVGSTIVWARFPELPLQFYEEDGLMLIGNSFGRAIKVDKNTSQATRGKFARVCVEIDLSKPIVPQFLLNGICYHIEYEGLYAACHKCSRYGHAKEACPYNSISLQDTTVNNSNSSIPAVEASNIQDGPGNSSVSKNGENTAQGSNYRDWVCVPKRQYNPKKKQMDVNQNYHSSPKENEVKKNNSTPTIAPREQKGKSAAVSSHPINPGFKFVATKSKGTSASRPPPHFPDLFSHNIFGDLADDVPDSSMDVDRALKDKENAMTTELSPGRIKRYRESYHVNEPLANRDMNILIIEEGQTSAFGNQPNGYNIGRPETASKASI